MVEMNLVYVGSVGVTLVRIWWDSGVEGPL